MTEPSTHINPEKPYPTPAMLASGYKTIAVYSGVRAMDSGNLVM